MSIKTRIKEVLVTPKERKILRKLNSQAMADYAGKYPFSDSRYQDNGSHGSNTRKELDS